MPISATRIFLLCLLLYANGALSQLQPAYQFMQDDSLLKKQYAEQALEAKNNLLASLPKENLKDFKEIYEGRYKNVSEFLNSSRAVTEPANCTAPPYKRNFSVNVVFPASG